MVSIESAHWLLTVLIALPTRLGCAAIELQEAPFQAKVQGNQPAREEHSLGIRSIKSVTTSVAAGLALALQFAAADALAVDLLTLAKQQALPAKAYPELRQINDQVANMIARMDANTTQLKEYRKSRIRASDRRYTALTREFNQSRSRLSEIERKLDKAPSLDLNRFPAPAGSDRGSSSSDVRDRAMTAENRKYDQVKGSLRQSLKTLSNHYDQQLREIAKLR